MILIEKCAHVMSDGSQTITGTHLIVQKSSQHVFVLSKCLFSVCLEEILYEKMNVN